MSDSQSGTQMGAARGTITIDAQVDAAQAKLQAFVQQVNQQMSQVGASANQASQGFASASASLRQFAAVFGIGLSAAGAVQLGKMAAAAEETAVAFNRQKVAAESLAGSQAQLNELMAIYDRDTGGILDKATELANVTQLLSVGFADSAKEIDQFATAIRGISVATGRSSDIITQNLILELFSQRGMRLDQLGLSYEKVRQRADQLAQSDRSLTQQQAYQNAVLDEATAKYGALVHSVDAQITGVEDLQKTIKNAGLSFGESFGPAINFVASAMSNWLKQAGQDIQTVSDLLEPFLHQLQQAGLIIQGLVHGRIIDLPSIDIAHETVGRDIGRHSGGGPSFSGPAPITDLNRAQMDWAQKTQDIERQASQARLEATQQFESQRANLERSYQTTVSRDAQDFAISRAREERDFAQSIAQVHADTTRQELEQATQLAQTLAQARADSADRLAELSESHQRSIDEKRQDAADKRAQEIQDKDDQIAQKRQDSANRLLEIEQQFNEQQTKATRDHHDRLADAVATGDARAVFAEQRRFGEEQDDARAAHEKAVNEQRQALDENLQQIKDAFDKRAQNEDAALKKQLDRENDAYNRQVEAEKAALDKRINQAQTAYDAQIAALKASDDQRTKDLQDAFTQRQKDEDADRSLHLTRMSDDHNAQLIELDAEQRKRITQIDTQQQQQRDELDAKFADQLHDMGIFTDAQKSHYEKLRDDAVKAFDAFWANLQKKITGTTLPPPTSGPMGPSRADLIAQRDALVKQQRGLDPTNPLWGDLLQRITALEQQINAMPATSAQISAAFMGRGAGAVPGMPSAVSSAMRSLAVTFAQGSIVINGVGRETANELAAMIDQRILRVVQVAAGRL